MEPLKIIKIGHFENERLIIYQTQTTEEIRLALIQLDRVFEEMGGNSMECPGIVFKCGINIGEGPARRMVELELLFPHLSEINESPSPENILEFYAARLLPISEICRFSGEEQLIPKNPDSSDLIHPDRAKLQRLWWFCGNLCWVNRPCRSAEDYKFIKLKVEEYVLENQDEYLRLQAKVKRLRELSTNSNSKSRPKISDSVVTYLLARDCGKCVICASEEDLQIDHIIPFSKGGSDEPENLRILCKTCNVKRGNLPAL